ncbi:MAG: SURF1 family protein [Phenylobacterium sp.]|uniref:SURF1 family protein n=1 Tax=Phenylobacterium sp. TaxID=1871053 RepID=UPI00391DA7ED
MTDRRFPLGLTLATVVALAILIGLGSWQVQRLVWKRDLLARIEQAQSAPPQALAPVLARVEAGEEAEFTRVWATCPGLAAAPYLQLYALKDGQAGVRLISACPLEGAPYGAILVDRGFVADDISARPLVDHADRATVEVAGMLRAPQPGTFVTPPNDPAANRWFTRDVAAMAQALQAPDPAPLMLAAETSSNPEWLALQPAPLPAAISNRHLEYAVTWFGLAAALAGVYAAMLWRKWKA